MGYDPANKIQDYWVFGEFGGVNPSITDSATFTFLSAEGMEQLFHEEVEGAYLYSRHMNASEDYLSKALARMEGTEKAHVSASGMSAIACTLFQHCQQGDEIVSSRTIYGGTYAILKNIYPRLGINTRFVDITNLDDVRKNITSKTKVIYCETISNPLLEVADIPELRKIADEHGLTLVVDNTFCPLVVTPCLHGAHVVVYSLTKFVNGMNDCLGGAICGSKELIGSMRNVTTGASMLFGPVLDSFRASSILKNLHTLHMRMKQHSHNAMYLAKKISELGIKVFYPGLESHLQHELLNKLKDDDYGYGGMLTIDVGDSDTAKKLMIRMQEEQVGYFAVSLGFYKTLFSSPGSSTSSEIPPEEQKDIGLSPGLVRFSVGLDHDIERSFQRIKHSMEALDII